MNWVWTQPNIRCIQVNVNIDGSYKTESEKEGIEGVFWDANGMILMQFSKELSVDSTIHLELLAIREGLLLAEASH